MRGVKIILAGFAALALAAGLLWHLVLAEQVAFARVATAYGAKKVCSCLHVSGRSLTECKADFTEDVGAVTLTDTGDGATAEVLWLRETALHVPGQGCRLMPEA